MMRTHLLQAAVAVMLFLLPLPNSLQEASAQVCFGTPTGGGSWVAAANVSASSGQTSYGGSLGRDLNSPLAASLGVWRSSYDSFDQRALGIGGSLGYEVAFENVSMCPFVSPSRVGGIGLAAVFFQDSQGRTVYAEEVADVVQVLMGLSVGGTLGEASNGPILIPSGGAGVVTSRITGERSFFPLNDAGQIIDFYRQELDTNVDTALFARASLTLALSRWFGTFGVAANTFEGSDSAITLSVGAVF